MNDRDKIIFGILLAYMLITASLGYVTSPARSVRPAFRVEVNSSSANLKLIKEVSNLDCREYESAAMQNGCIVMRQKVLTLLGVTPPKFKPTMSSGWNTPKQVCFPDKGLGFLEFNVNNTYLMRNSTEIRLNRLFLFNITKDNMTKYNKVRVYV